MTSDNFKRSPRYRKMKQMERQARSESNAVDTYTKAMNFKTRDEMKDRLGNLRAFFTDNNKGAY